MLKTENGSMWLFRSIDISDTQRAMPPMHKPSERSFPSLTARQELMEIPLRSTKLLRLLVSKVNTPQHIVWKSEIQYRDSTSLTYCALW